MTNFHTHTARCKHATNTDEEYVQAAIEAGYQVFGFADHCPWPYANGFVSGIRMDVDQLDEYVESLQQLRSKYREAIDLRIGLECEYFPEYFDWLRRTAEQKHIHYLILGNHHDLTDDGGFYFGASTRPEHIRLYTQRTIQGMRTGLFSYLAHPDVVMRSYPEFDTVCEEMAISLCETALEMDLPLEYNLMGNEYKKMSGLPWKGAGYPAPRFWEIAARMGCKAIIGLDSHQADHVRKADTYREAVSYLDSSGIQRVEDIRMFNQP